MEINKNQNIILINLDGLRRHKVEICANLKSLKETSIYFEEIDTVAPYTFASLHSVFSGMYPSRHGVDGYYNLFKFKKDEIKTLTEILKQAGYYTCCDIIDDSVIPQQGFDDFNIFDEETVNFPDRHSQIIKDSAKKGKFFLFLHYTEVHKHLVREVVQKYKQEDNDDHYFKLQKENHTRYDSYLPSCDNYIQTILQTLKDLKIHEKTTLVIFSDHGTSIGEKSGEKFYGVYVYEYTLNTFCIISIPKTAHKTFKKQCSTIDIYPTLAELVGGLKNMDPKIQGKSLFEFFQNNDSPERELFAETGGLYGPWPSPKRHNVFCVKFNSKKLIYNDTPETWEFYNLKEDPNELNNIYDKNSEQVNKLKERLLFFLKTNNIVTKIS